MENVEGDARPPHARHQHRGDHAGEQQEVDLAGDAEALAVAFVLLRRGARLAPVEEAVHAVIEHQQQDGDEQHRHQHGPRWPEEIDALQEAQEQRRVAERRQRAADIRHQEDEEHHGVDLVAPPLIGLDDRADEQHRRACGPHPARQHRAEQQDAGVDDGRADQPAGEPDAAGHGKEREQQDDEGNVFEQRHMQHLEQGELPAEHDQEGQQEGERPEGRDLAEMVVPEGRRQQRKERDRQQDADEGHAPDEPERAAVQMRRVRAGGQRRPRAEQQGRNGCGEHAHGSLPDSPPKPPGPPAHRTGQYAPAPVPGQDGGICGLRRAG